MARIGVVGLGAMGQAIARRLLQTGHTVMGFNRTRSKAEALEPDGLVIADTLADACAADFVLNVLWDDAAVEEVLLPDGELFSAGRDLCHISVSTLSIPLARTLADKHRALGQSFVAAPVFGRPEDAPGGNLVVLTGGPGRGHRKGMAGPRKPRPRRNRGRGRGCRERGEDGGEFHDGIGARKPARSHRTRARHERRPKTVCRHCHDVILSGLVLPAFRCRPRRPGSCIADAQSIPAQRAVVE